MHSGKYVLSFSTRFFDYFNLPSASPRVLIWSIYSMNVLNMNMALTLLGCAGLTVLTGLPSVPVAAGKVINMRNGTPRLPVQSCFRFKMAGCVHCLYYPFTDGIRHKVTVLRACCCVYWKSETKLSPLLIWNNWLLPIEFERWGLAFYYSLHCRLNRYLSPV